VADEPRRHRVLSHSIRTARGPTDLAGAANGDRVEYAGADADFDAESNAWRDANADAGRTYSHTNPPPSECRVPAIRGRTTSQALNDWVTAGFHANKFTVSFGTPNYVIATEAHNNQSGTWDNTAQNCGSFDLTVGP